MTVLLLISWSCFCRHSRLVPMAPRQQNALRPVAGAVPRANKGPIAAWLLDGLQSDYQAKPPIAWGQRNAIVLLSAARNKPRRNRAQHFFLTCIVG